jgi:hypothetical protein
MGECYTANDVEMRFETLSRRPYFIANLGALALGVVVVGRKANVSKLLFVALFRAGLALGGAYLPVNRCQCS